MKAVDSKPRKSGRGFGILVPIANVFSGSLAYVDLPKSSVLRRGESTHSSSSLDFTLRILAASISSSDGICKVTGVSSSRSFFYPSKLTKRINKNGRRLNAPHTPTKIIKLSKREAVIPNTSNVKNN